MNEIPDQVRDEGRIYQALGLNGGFHHRFIKMLHNVLICAINTLSLRPVSVMLVYLLVTAGWLLFPGFLAAEISQSLEGADSLSVGTPFTFRINAEYSIRRVSIPDSLESFAIVSSKQSEKSSREWEMRIVPLKTGALSFPRLQVQPTLPAYQAEYTDGFRVNVLSVLAQGDTLLRDIKPMARYPLQAPFWLYLLLAGLALALAIILFRKRKKKVSQAAKPETQPLTKVLPPWQLALQELEALVAENLLEKAEVILYHFRLSQILRGFLEATQGFPALEMTTREVGSELQKMQLPEAGEIKRWLSYCDMVKFAKTIPTSEEIDYRTNWLKSYLQAFAAPKDEAEGA